MKAIRDRLLADPEIAAIIVRSTFEAVDAVTLVVNFNDARSDYRRLVAEDWCQVNATGRWRRRIQERRGAALRDQVKFEFETLSDVVALRSFLATKGW